MATLNVFFSALPPQLCKGCFTKWGTCGLKEAGDLVGIGRRINSIRIALVAVVVGATGALCFGVGPAAADNTITVNTTQTTYTQGDGLCSLAEAVDYSDGNPDSDCSTAPRSGTTTIKLPAGKYLVPGSLELDDPTDIVGSGAASTDLDGNDSSQVLNIDSTATVTISGVEISGGNSGVSTAGCSGSGISFNCPNGETGNNGGGVINFGNLTLQSVTVAGNHAGDGTSPIVGVRICAPTCAGGNGANGGSGGGIYNTGTLTIENSTITGNSSGVGGAGESAENGTIGTGPGANGGDGGVGGTGGGIASLGSLTVMNSTISGNQTGSGGAAGNGSSATGTGDNGGSGGLGGSGGPGAGIYSDGNPLTVTGSTLSGNQAGNGGNAGSGGAGNGSGTDGASGEDGFGGDAGAAYSAFSTAAFTNDTIFGNATGAAGSDGTAADGGFGGGLSFADTGVTLSDVTIADNSAHSSAIGGGAIFVNPGFAAPVERNAIVASNAAPTHANCAGTEPVDAGHNIVFGDSTCPGAVENPRLGGLADNGGPTETVALLSGSPAIDTVPPSDCVATTDQRGVSRPQGGSCDAGAYEVAPPTFDTATAVAAGPESATVSGQVNPNLTDAKLTVRYGTTTAYGSSTAATDLGAGDGPKSFSIGLTGLTPGTTYHVQLVATNNDGTSTSNDLTLSTPIALTTGTRADLTASVASHTIKGTAVSVRIACAAGGTGCSGALKLTSHVTTKGSKVVAVAAKAKRKTAVRTMGSGRYSLAAGTTKIVKLTLNGAGKRLLKTRHRLPTTMTLTGAARVTMKLTFISAPKRVKKRRHAKVAPSSQGD